MFNWEDWYDILSSLASKHGESVADADAWRFDFDNGLTPEESFYGEYPEHKPGNKG